ncbi:MAG TPA: RNA polymerase sigma factor [Bryobacteraceae bacterium]
MPLSAAAWGAEYLEDISHRRLVLEYYDREHIPLRRYVLFLGLDAESCGEIVQETFLRLHEHLLAGGDQTNLRAWLFRVAHNLARNSQTAFPASRTDPLADVTSRGDLPARADSAEDELLAKERMQRLGHAMEQLSAAQRGCLILRSQGLKYREIADVLKIGISTVGENIQRGLDRLRELL